MPIHPFAPIYDGDSRILILGTFPSVKSREVQFYYGHPRNRFWKTLAAILGSSVPATVEEKICFLKHHRIALWDTCAACEIRGSADLKIFVDLDSDERLVRRIDKFMARGQTKQEVTDRYIDTVRFRHNELIEPTRWHADVVANGVFDRSKVEAVILSYVKANV